MAKEEDDFVCGVIEGFYGQPWSADQRRGLFLQLQELGLNAYVYAPKDDHKHRLHWRTPYDAAECKILGELIHAAQAQNIEFIYAVSPGLDISYSSDADMTLLKAKLDQIAALGCCSFAILFDDIATGLSPEDQNAFDSFAHAQAAVTNCIHSYLMPKRSLFCPTEYCSTRAVPSVAESTYLRTLGAELDAAIQIFWTGPDVISTEISAENLIEVASALGRKPVLWDNIHANDYDFRVRVFMGPYEGRCAGLRGLVAGVLTNPNCEFNLNFIPLHTLSAFLRQGSGYVPGAALDAALRDWMYLWHGRPGKQAGTPPDSPAQRLAEDDVRVLVDFFGLPWRHGQLAVRLAAGLRALATDGASPRTGLLSACRTLRALLQRLTRALPRHVQAELRPYLANMQALGCICECAAEGVEGPWSTATPQARLVAAAWAGPDPGEDQCVVALVNMAQRLAPLDEGSLAILARFADSHAPCPTCAISKGFST